MKRFIPFLLLTVLLTSCSPRPTNPTLRVGDIVVIDKWAWQSKEYTIDSLSQDGSKFRVEGHPFYLDTDDYQFHIIRRAPVQAKPSAP